MKRACYTWFWAALFAGTSVGGLLGETATASAESQLAVGHPSEKNVLITETGRMMSSRRTASAPPRTSAAESLPSLQPKSDRNALQRFGDSMSGTISGAWHRMTGAMGRGAGSLKKWGSRKPKPAKDDPLSLSNKVRKPDADFYVAAARLLEAKGKLAEAETNYKLALDEDRNHLEAALGYARLLDRQGKLSEATKQYVDATRRHPHEAAAFNDLGLCLARQGRLNESVEAIHQAIAIRPQRKLYRNNLATVLVEMGHYDEAFQTLKVAHGEAVAHYNLGYLLSQKGDRRAASQHFARAVEINPQFADARRWLDLTAARTAIPSPAANSSQPPQRAAASRVAAPSGQAMGPPVPTIDRQPSGTSSVGPGPVARPAMPIAPITQTPAYRAAPTPARADLRVPPRPTAPPQSTPAPSVTAPSRVPPTINQPPNRPSRGNPEPGRAKLPSRQTPSDHLRYPVSPGLPAAPQHAHGAQQDERSFYYPPSRY